MTQFNFRTEFDLPQIPIPTGNPLVDQNLASVYSAIQILAQQIDTVLTLSEDIRIDSGSRGLVLKDNQATPHYWRITVSNVGALIVTDIGTTLPT